MIDKRYITFKREPFFEIAKSYIQIDSKVLDIGAGNGSFSDYCGRSDFFLFDGNEKSIEYLKEKYPNSFFGKLPVLPFETEFFDLVHCSHIVEHLLPEDLYKTLLEIDRCLKFNGYLIISTPLYWEKFYGDLSHIKPYCPEVFRKYLAKSEGQTFTRKKISDNYVVDIIRYRYREIPLIGSIYFTKENLVKRLVTLTSKLLYKFGARRYEKTGYTMVLKKHTFA